LTSRETNRKIVKLLLEHIPLPTAQRLFRELCHVPGNSSFCDSVQALDVALQSMRDDTLLDLPSEVLKVTSTHVIRKDKDSIIVHRVVNGKEQMPNGYMLGINMTDMR
jgi:hypothetical protein